MAHDDYPPIVVITSNSERELPAPFLRRCVFFHIADPDKDALTEILVNKFFSARSGRTTEGDREPLPPFYQELLNEFMAFRDGTEGLQYTPGTSELIDWTRALRFRGVNPKAPLQAQLPDVKATASAIAKHRDDLQELVARLDKLSPQPT